MKSDSIPGPYNESSNPEKEGLAVELAVKRMSEIQQGTRNLYSIVAEYIAQTAPTVEVPPRSSEAVLEGTAASEEVTEDQATSADHARRLVTEALENGDDSQVKIGRVA